MSHNAHAAPAKFKLDFPPFWDVEMDSDDEASIMALKKDIGGHLETDTTVMSSW